MSLEISIESLLDFYGPHLADFLKEKCFNEKEINQHYGKTLIVFNQNIVKLKNAIEQLENELKSLENIDLSLNREEQQEQLKQQKIKREEINHKKNILTSKLIEKKLLIELVKLKASAIQGHIFLSDYVNQRDLVLTNIIVHRAKMYRDKEKLKNYCCKYGILLDSNWFTQYDISMMSNKHDSLGIIQDKLDESRNLCTAVQEKYENGTLLKKYTENQKEVAVTSLVIPFYVNEKIVVNRITLMYSNDNYQTEKGQR